ncbi:MAG: tyrosine-protein phosphatase [Bacteroidia bacterium]
MTNLTMSIFSKLFNIKPKNADSSFVNPITTEVHSHLIPNIDDGVQSLEESITVFKNFADRGYKKVITTPHIMGDFYKNGPENILPALEIIRAELRSQGIELEIQAAAEYMIDDAFEKKIASGSLLTFGQNHVLVELPFTEEPANFKSALFELRIAGYKPVLAHPERYAFMAMRKDKYTELFEQGVLFQINLFSLIGYYSPQVKKTAEYLIENKMVHLVGSDCHGHRHLPVLDDALKSYNYQRICQLPLINNTL